MTNVVFKMDDVKNTARAVEQKSMRECVEITMTNDVKDLNEKTLNKPSDNVTKSNDLVEQRCVNIPKMENVSMENKPNMMPTQEKDVKQNKKGSLSPTKDSWKEPVVPARTFQTQVSRPDILEQMKRQINQTFANFGGSTPKIEKDAKTTLMPGTNSEYRTPGANNVNKNGRIKRPMNAFMVWAREIRGQLALAMPNATNSDISIRLGDLWKKLPETHKQRYYKMAEMIKQKHRHDYPDWVYRPSPVLKRRDELSVDKTGGSTSDLQNLESSAQTGPSATACNSTMATGSTITQKFIPQCDFRRTVPYRPGQLFISNNTKNLLADRLGQSQDNVRFQGGNTPVNNCNMIPGRSFQLLTINNNAIARGPGNSGGTLQPIQPSMVKPIQPIHPSNVQPIQPAMLQPLQPSMLQPKQPTLQQHSAVTTRPNVPATSVSGLVPQLVPTSNNIMLEPGHPNSSGNTSTQFRHILPGRASTGAGGVPNVTPRLPSQFVRIGHHDNKATSDIVVQSGLSVPDTSSSRVAMKPTETGTGQPTVVEAGLSQQVVDSVQQPGQPSEQAKSCKTDCLKIGPQPKADGPSFNDTVPCDWDEDLQLDVESFLSRVQSDDLWPFPFPETPSDEWLDEKPERPLYHELLTSHDPFITCDYLYSEVYPGCLHLDMDRWEKFLAEEEVVDLSEPCPDDTDDADNITISPLPLKDTLSKLLGASVEASDMGDIIVGDLLTDFTHEIVVTSDGHEDVTDIAPESVYVWDDARSELSPTYHNLIYNSDSNADLNVLPQVPQRVQGRITGEDDGFTDTALNLELGTLETSEEIQHGAESVENISMKLKKPATVSQFDNNLAKDSINQNEIPEICSSQEQPGASKTVPVAVERLPRTPGDSKTITDVPDTIRSVPSKSKIGGKPTVSVKPLPTTAPSQRNVFDMLENVTSSTKNTDMNTIDLDKKTKPITCFNDKGSTKPSISIALSQTVKEGEVGLTNSSKTPHHTINVDPTKVDLRKLLTSTFRSHAKQ